MHIPWFEIFVGSYFLWVLVACATLLLDRRSPTATLAWIFAFIAIPIVSGLYYMVFGPRRLQRRRRRYGIVRGAVRKGLAKDEGGAERPKLSADASGLATVGKRLGQGEPTFASAVQLLDNGDECMQALEEKIVAAKHHSHLEYYIWEPERVGAHLRELRAEAARTRAEV